MFYYGKETIKMKIFEQAKNMVEKVDKGRALGIFSAAVGIAGMLLSNKVEANNRAKMKAEIIEELSQKKN
jgi:hypothetical protein